MPTAEPRTRAAFAPHLSRPDVSGVASGSRQERMIAYPPLTQQGHFFHEPSLSLNLYLTFILIILHFSLSMNIQLTSH